MPKKVDVRNLVCHCQKGTSDKVYIASIRDNADGSFTVIGKWGPNGKLNLMSMERCTVDEWFDACGEQRDLFNSKLSKGYVDITSDYYDGDVTYNTPCIKQNLEKGKFDKTNEVEAEDTEPAYLRSAFPKKKRYKTISLKPLKVVDDVEPVEPTGRRRFDLEM